MKRQKGQGLGFGEFWKACRDLELDVSEKAIHDLFDYIAGYGAAQKSPSSSRRAPLKRTTNITMKAFSQWWFGGQIPAFSDGSFLEHLSNSADMDRGAMKHKGETQGERVACE